MIPIVIGVTILVFTIIWFTPGDAAEVLAGNAPQEQVEELRHEMGLDRPYVVQLGDYLYKVFIKFDFGTALVNKTSISSDIAMRFPKSLTFAVFGILFSVVFGIPLGIYAALHQNKMGDVVATVFSLLCVSTPGFWLALILVLLFSYKLGWLPAYGLGGIEYWILPVAANCFHGVAVLCRQTRSSMLEVIRSDYIVMAKSKGLSEQEVIVRHALPNALIPIIAVAGMNFGGMLGGGLIIEKVFSIPGIGNYLVTAVGQRDYTAVMGGVVITSLFFSIVMLLADLCMAIADPRIKAQYSSHRRRKNG